MAAAALEAFIAWGLNKIENRMPLPNGLWDWINGRDHWTKEPSVNEKFDVLLRILTGHSLKDDGLLWQDYKELRRARNSLAHTGLPMIGSNVVDAAKAKKLVDAAERIVKWVEALIPPECRRKRTDAAGPFSRRLATAAESTSISPVGTRIEVAEGGRLQHLIEPGSESDLSQTRAEVPDETTSETGVIVGDADVQSPDNFG